MGVQVKLKSLQNTWHTRALLRWRFTTKRHYIKCMHLYLHLYLYLRQLHWLTVSWRIDFKLAVLVYKCLHGLAPSYLADEFHHPAESEFRRRLRSPSSHELSVSRTRLSTYGERTFPVAAVRISLLQHVTSAPSLSVFCTRLKTCFFELCY